ncbi:hypothetical protein ACF08O_25995 [Streptomyces paradoxus]|uniref:hypothetical protein n=1 Tax=Streptomyces paradoxus TaxID=66375 RepID=UPI0036FC0D4A
MGQVDQDWVTKGAHVNMKDGIEVALRPDGQGGIRGEAIRLRNGTATQKKEGRNPQWRFNNGRTAGLQDLIEAMERM